MLKQQAATTVFSRAPPRFALYTPVIIPKMSTTEGAIRPQAPHGLDHAADTVEEMAVKQQRKPETAPRFFPLGYKDAAYQWVSR